MKRRPLSQCSEVAHTVMGDKYRQIGRYVRAMSLTAEYTFRCKKEGTPGTWPGLLDFLEKGCTAPSGRRIRGVGVEYAYQFLLLVFIAQNHGISDDFGRGMKIANRWRARRLKAAAEHSKASGKVIREGRS